MARGLKYTLLCKSRVNKFAYSLKLSFEGYSGPEIDRNMPRDQPLVLRKDRNKNGAIKGTSLEFGIREEVDFEFDEFYTNNAKHILAQLYKESSLLWAGYVLPQQYQAPYVNSPLTIRFTATDGLGILINEDFELTGFKSFLEIIVYCIDKIGLGLGYSIAINLFATLHNHDRSPLAQTYVDCEIYNGLDCLTVIEEVLKPYNADITQSGARWHITCSADTKSTRMLYTSAGVYEGTESAPAVLNLGYPDIAGTDVYPVGSALQRSMEPGAKKVTIKHNYGLQKSMLSNWSFSQYENSMFVGWTKVGTFTPTRKSKDGKYYCFIPTRATDPNDSIYQEIEITNVPGQRFIFEIDSAMMGFQTSELSSGIAYMNMAFRIIVALSNGVSTYYLKQDGGYAEWTTELTFITLSLPSSISSPVWNRLKMITNALPISGTMQVKLCRFYTASPRPEETYVGVAYSEPSVYFLQDNEMYPGGMASVASFDNSTEPGKLETIELMAADAPAGYENAKLLYKNIVKYSDGTPIT